MGTAGTSTRRKLASPEPTESWTKKSDVQSELPTETGGSGKSLQNIQAYPVASTAANGGDPVPNKVEVRAHPRLSSDRYMCATAHTCACMGSVGAHTNSEVRKSAHSL